MVVSSQSKVQKIRAVGRKVPEVLPGETWSGEEMLGYLEFQDFQGMKALAVYNPLGQMDFILRKAGENFMEK